jgi:hypothetical protein
MIQICAFKKKKKEGGEGRPQFGDPWKVSNLMALGEVSCSVAFGTKRRSIFFIFFIFP